MALGICIGLYEYFEERKNKTFSNMNITLYEKEQPENIIETGEKIKEESKDDNENQNQTITNTYLGVLEIPIPVKIVASFI